MRRRRIRRSSRGSDHDGACRAGSLGVARPAHRRSPVAAGAAAASGGTPGPSLPTRARQHAGPEHQRPGLAGLRRERLDRPGGRLGDRLRGRDRLQGQRPGLRDLGRGVHACSRRTPSSSTSSRHRATRAFGSFAAGYVQPVNVDLFKSYPDIFPALKDKPYNTVDGVHYGVPARPRLEPADVADRPGRPRPRRPGPRCSIRPTSPQGQSVYDAPIYIADAAVVLMTTKPELEIKNPYALDDTQFQAAVDLLKQQKPMITQYWVDYTKQMDEFRNGDVERRDDLADHHEPAPGRGRRPSPVDVIKPSEGATGWSDTWMINSKTKNLGTARTRSSTTSPRRRPTPDRRVVRRGPGQLEGVRADGHPGPLRHLPCQRRRLLAGRLVLADARGGVRRRPNGRDVQGLRRLDQGLDRDQGLT